MKKRKRLAAIAGTGLVFLVLLSAFMAGRDLHERKQDADAFEELAERITIEEPDTAPEKEVPPEETASGEYGEYEGNKRDLSLLFEENADCIGWLSIPGTAVDYPVMYTPKEPERYLRKNFYGTYSISGVPFLDGRCSPDGANLIIYGHNMSNGSMFGSLRGYLEKDYFTEHPAIELETASGRAVYQIFSVMRTDKDDTWYRFLSAYTEEDFLHQSRYARQSSLYDTGVIPKYGQQILTLSTCYGRSGTDERLLVLAVKTE